MFRRYSLITAEGEALGQVAFVRRNFQPGDLISQGRGGMVRVVHVVEPDEPYELPLRCVEFVRGADSPRASRLTPTERLFPARAEDGSEPTGTFARTQY